MIKGDNFYGENIMREVKETYDSYIKAIFHNDFALEEDRLIKTPTIPKQPDLIKVVMQNKKETKEAFFNENDLNDEDTDDNDDDEELKKLSQTYYNFEDQEKIMMENDQELYFKKAILSAIVSKHIEEKEKVYLITLTKGVQN